MEKEEKFSQVLTLNFLFFLFYLILFLLIFCSKMKERFLDA